MYTNKYNIDLPLAIWLSQDSYDHDPRPNLISATSILKPLRAIVLGLQHQGSSDTDISDLVASRMGTALHDSIETAWTNPEKLKEALTSLSYPKKVVENIRVNPTELNDGDIPIYLERRSEKELNGIIISGKFDFVSDGMVQDFKSTGSWSYIKQTNTDKYILQGSIYRWLNQDIITNDLMKIHFIFTDWSAANARKSKDYPPSRLLSQTLNLMSVDATERYLRDKIAEIHRLVPLGQDSLPECTAEDLWQDPPVYAYYKKIGGTKSTKNFTTYHEAHARLLADGSTGEIVTRPSMAKACSYCNAKLVCNQRKDLINRGAAVGD